MIVLDANVMIAVLDPGDAHHLGSRDVFRRGFRERLVAHPLTLAEALVLAARDGRTRAVASALDALGVGRLDEPDDPIALADLRDRSGLRMPDACVVLAAQRDRAKLATFDQRLAAAARAEGVEVVG